MKPRTRTVAFRPDFSRHTSGSPKKKKVLLVEVLPRIWEREKPSFFLDFDQTQPQTPSGIRRVNLLPSSGFQPRCRSLNSQEREKGWRWGARIQGRVCPPPLLVEAFMKINQSLSFFLSRHSLSVSPPTASPDPSLWQIGPVSCRPEAG